jgi:hypothetical protein
LVLYFTPILKISQKLEFVHPKFKSLLCQVKTWTPTANKRAIMYPENGNAPALSLLNIKNLNIKYSLIDVQVINFTNCKLTDTIPQRDSIRRNEVIFLKIYRKFLRLISLLIPITYYPLSKDITKMLSQNPYIAGNPVGNSTAFVGRDDILREVMRVMRDHQENAIVLYGQRRMGKTSVLQELETKLPKEGAYQPVFFDLLDKAQYPLKRVLRELLDKISDTLGKRTLI